MAWCENTCEVLYRPLSTILKSRKGGQSLPEDGFFAWGSAQGVSQPHGRCWNHLTFGRRALVPSVVQREAGTKGLGVSVCKSIRNGKSIVDVSMASTDDSYVLLWLRIWLFDHHTVYRSLSNGNHLLCSHDTRKTGIYIEAVPVPATFLRRGLRCSGVHEPTDIYTGERFPSQLCHHRGDIHVHRVQLLLHLFTKYSKLSGGRSICVVARCRVPTVFLSILSGTGRVVWSWVVLFSK